MSDSRSATNVEIDEEGCIGAGQCVLAAPDVFDQREDDGIGIVLRSPRSDDRDAVDEAIERCPAQAVRWIAGDST